MDKFTKESFSRDELDFIDPAIESIIKDGKYIVITMHSEKGLNSYAFKRAELMKMLRILDQNEDTK